MVDTSSPLHIGAVKEYLLRTELLNEEAGAAEIAR